jgi:nicotinamidase-related amidase
MTADLHKPYLLEREKTGLLVIDLQPPLLEKMWNKQELTANVRRLAEGVRILGLPILLTEQYPQKLGPTAPCIAEVLAETTAFAKLAFSCCRERPIMEALRAQGKSAWLVCGIEAHVCVSQTALDLLSQDYKVQVVADAVGSRTQANWQTGLDRLRQAGAVITSTEMALFELLERAGTDEFRAVQRLVK